MTLDQVINLVIAAATCAAAWGAWAAARAGKKQGKAAWEQLELQRPRPVVIIEGKWNLDNYTGEPDGFLFRNLGSSPAFEVTVSGIEGPRLPSVGYPEYLTTERIDALAETPARATHNRWAPRNNPVPLTNRAVLHFVQNAAAALPSKKDTLEFFLTYSALDKSRIETPCLIRFHVGLNGWAEVVPVVNWLGKKSKETTS